LFCVNYQDLYWSKSYLPTSLTLSNLKTNASTHWWMFDVQRRTFVFVWVYQISKLMPPLTCGQCLMFGDEHSCSFESIKSRNECHHLSVDNVPCSETSIRVRSCVHLSNHAYGSLEHYTLKHLRGGTILGIRWFHKSTSFSTRYFTLSRCCVPSSWLWSKLMGPVKYSWKMCISVDKGFCLFNWWHYSFDNGFRLICLSLL
jgi:hypothetical protein